MSERGVGLGADEILVPSDIRIVEPSMQWDAQTIGKYALYVGGALILYAVVNNYLYSE